MTRFNLHLADDRVKVSPLDTRLIRAELKSALVAAACRGWLPGSIVTLLFRVFRLRAL